MNIAYAYYHQCQRLECANVAVATAATVPYAVTKDVDKVQSTDALALVAWLSDATVAT